MISRLGLVIIMEPDIDAAVAFYEKLGLHLNFHLKGSWAEFDLPSGQGVKICLCPAAPEEVVRRTGLVFELPDLKAFYAAHKDDIPFVGELLEKVHGIMISVQDPGGNIVELYQPTPEKVQQLVKEAKEREDDCDQTPNSRSCGAGKKCCRQDQVES